MNSGSNRPIYKEKKKIQQRISQYSDIENFKHPSAPEGLNVTGQIPGKLSWI